MVLVPAQVMALAWASFSDGNGVGTSIGSGIGSGLGIGNDDHNGNGT